jgi:hypothetical protein
MDNENTTTASENTSVNSDRKDSDKKSIIYIIISFLIILVAGGAYFMGTRNVNPEASPSPTPEAEMALPDSSPLESPTTTTTPKPTLTPSPTPTPTPSPMADLYISEYSFDHPPKQGEAFTVKIGIYNKGDKAAAGFWWEWWATVTAPTYACRERIDSIAAHGGKIVYCTYTYSGWSTYTTKAIADKDNEVPESDEGNNTHEEQVIPIH